MFHKFRPLHSPSLYMILYDKNSLSNDENFLLFQTVQQYIKTVKDLIKCSSHTFSGKLREMADTVILESFVPFFSFFLLSFFLPFLFPFFCYLSYRFICSYRHDPKH